MPSAPQPAPPPAEKHCRNCVHAIPGRFVPLAGQPAPLDAANLLMSCEKRHWPGIVLANTLYQSSVYRKRAANCADFVAAQTAVSA